MTGYQDSRVEILEQKIEKLESGKSQAEWLSFIALAIAILSLIATFYWNRKNYVLNLRRRVSELEKELTSLRPAISEACKERDAIDHSRTQNKTEKLASAINHCRTAIENLMNCMDKACAEYLDGELHRGRFDKAFKQDFIEYVHYDDPIVKELYVAGQPRPFPHIKQYVARHFIKPS